MRLVLIVTFILGPYVPLEPALFAQGAPVGQQRPAAAGAARDVPDVSGTWEGALNGLKGEAKDTQVRITLEVGDWYNFQPATGEKRLSGDIDTIRPSSTVTLPLNGGRVNLRGLVTIIENFQHLGGRSVLYPDCQKTFTLQLDPTGATLTGVWEARAVRPQPGPLAILSEKAECPYGANGQVTLKKRGNLPQ